MGIQSICKKAEKCNDEELRQLIMYIGGLLIGRNVEKETYEGDFIETAKSCGLNSYAAEMSLIDFKMVSAVYMQKAETLFLEDIGQVLEFVLRKNGYASNVEANEMLNSFLENSFGKNIPSMAV